MSSTTNHHPGLRAYAPIALVSCAVILFETLITRILSVVLQYHFAFLSISLAMLGLGAPGVWFALSKPGERTLERLLLGAGAATPLAVGVIVRLGSTFRTHPAFWIVTLLVPLLLLGAAVCVILIEARDRIGQTYGADLLGAAVGAAAAVPLLQGLPTPSVVAALGILPLIAVFVASTSRGARLVASLVLAVIVGGLAWRRPFELHYNKTYTETTAPLYERWSPTARITVLEQDPMVEGRGFAGWGMGTHAPSVKPKNLWIDQDGSAGTEILAWKRGDELPPYVWFDVSAAAPQLFRSDSVCIIGGGGGRDILLANGSGARAIDVVELNRYTVEAVSSAFGGYSGDPYHLPNVTTTVDEGRSHIASSTRRYDLVQISLIDTFAATAAGAYALSENALYTVEAVQTYFRHLTPDGVVSISRWSAGPGRLEATRMAILAVEALRLEGIEEPRRHLLILNAGAVANVMITAKPLDAATIARADALAERRGFVRHWPPSPATPRDSLIAATLAYGTDTAARLGFDLSPTTDDRPFFFQTIDLLHPPAKDLRPPNDATLLLRNVLITVMGIALPLFFLPFVVRRGLFGGPGMLSGTIYFAAIGFGFMLVEVPLVHRASVWLGHPSRAAVVVIATLLLGAGIGSTYASRWSKERARLAFLLLPLVIGLLSLGIGPICTTTAGWPLAARVCTAILLLGPAGVLMGLPFARGIAWFGDARVSWWWAINGAASVAASVFALALALVVGLANVIALGVVAYLVATVIGLRQLARTP